MRPGDLKQALRIAPFSKAYDGVPALDFPGIELTPGRIYAIIGANGSGKSTFAKVLSGVLPPEGRTSPLEPGVRVGCLPQKPHPFRMSTRANILLGGDDRGRADRLMEGLQIGHLSAKRADRLSGGETARMALARLMMGRFDLAILDEPTAAMDMETTSLAEELILQYVRETDCVMILVTHSLQQARRLADDALFFHRGRLLERGAKEQILYDPAQPETRQFLEFYGI